MKKLFKKFADFFYKLSGEVHKCKTFEEHLVEQIDGAVMNSARKLVKDIENIQIESEQKAHEVLRALRNIHPLVAIRDLVLARELAIRECLRR